jgi:GNAT superfamily N-acetyltransferase
MGRRDDVFWAGFLGVAPEDWSTRGISYRSHAGLSGYRGFWCFRRNDRVVVSAPSGWVERMRVMLSGWDQDRLMDRASLAEALGADFERSIGPAFQGCLEADRFAGRAAPSVRRLVPADGEAVDLFRIDCGTGDWDSSGLARAERWRHASFEGEKITAIGGYRSWSDDAGDPCVLTHPEFRGGGRGAAVTSAVVADALSSGKLLLYQTLESNEAAVRIALSLGYVRYGSHVAVRLKREAPEE